MRSLHDRESTAVTAAVALAAAIWIACAPAHPVPPFDPMGEHPVYALDAAPWLVALEPVMHAPWEGTAHAGLAGALTFVLVTLCLVIARLLGASSPAAILVAVSVCLAPAVAAMMRHAGDLACAVMLAWGALAACTAIDAWAGPRRVLVASLVASGVVGLASAVALHWAALLIFPLCATVVMATHLPRPYRAAAVAMFGVAAAAGLYVWSLRMAAPLDVALPDVWHVAAGTFARPRPPVFVGPAVVDAWPALLVGLIVLGAMVTSTPGWRTGTACAAVCAAIVWAALPAWRPDVLRAAGWLASPLAAVALTWAAHAPASGARSHLVVWGLGAILVSSSVVASAQPVGGADKQAFSLTFLQGLEELSSTGGPMAIVAEDTKVDSAVVAWGGPALRLPQDRARVAAALESGVTVIAGPTGRAHLELLGFRFARVAAYEQPFAFEWSRVTGQFTCTEVSTDRWSQLPGLEYTGRVGFEVPAGAGGELAVIVADELPMAVRAEGADRQVLAVTLERLTDGVGPGAPPVDYWFNTTDDRRPPAHVSRLRIASHRDTSRYVSLHLGRRGPRVLARLEKYEGSALGHVCAQSLHGEPIDGFAGSVDVRLTDDEWVGAGWFGLERDGEGTFRWMGEAAALLVPTVGSRPRRLSITAAPAHWPGDGEPTLTILLNGVALAAQRMRPGASNYVWDVPPGAWGNGTNEVLLRVSRTVQPAGDPRRLGASVRGFRVEMH